MAAYTAVEKGVEESFDRDEQQVTRTFHVTPWAQRAAFVADVKGGVTLVGGRLFRVFPMRDPDYRWMFARSVKITPLEEDYGTVAQAANSLIVRAQYQTAVATVTYAPLDNDQGDSDKPQNNEQQELDLATFNWDFSARSLTLPSTWFVWVDQVGGVNDFVMANSNVAATKVYPGLQVVVTRHLVARQPHEAILGQLGRVNKKDFFLAGNKYPKETLRFDSAKISRKITTKGIKFAEISYTFGCQPIYDLVLADGTTKGYVGWLRMFDPRKGYWRYVRTNTSPSKYLYEYDEDGPPQAIDGQNKTGFRLLFNPAAK